MRIRRRPTDALQRAPTPSPSQAPSPPAAPPSSAVRAPAPCSETAPARWAQPPVSKVDPSKCQEEPFDPRSPSRGRNRQEQKEEGVKATEDEKRGKEDGRSELHEQNRAVHVVRGYLYAEEQCAPAAPKQEEEEEERPTEEVEEKKSEDPRRVPADEEEKSTAAGAMCKKGDGKGWRCKRAAQSGYSLCQYHLDKLRSYYSYSQTKKKQKKKPKAASATEKSTSARVLHSQGVSQQKKNNKKRRVEEDVLGTGLGISDSFYYYSGFGPRWGKRRGESRSVEGGVRLPDGGASQVELRRGEGDAAAAAAAAAVAVGVGEEDEYDCDASSRDGKPLKSRALSSLL